MDCGLAVDSKLLFLGSNCNGRLDVSVNVGGTINDERRFYVHVINGILIVIRFWCFVGNASQRSAVAQPETRAVMDLIQEKGFALSVALDGGSVLVTYPYDKPVQPGLLSLY